MIESDSDRARTGTVLRGSVDLGDCGREQGSVGEAQWSSIGFRELLSTTNARLSLLAGKLRDESALETRVGAGSVSGGILDLAEQVEADLIVLASHRPEMKDWLIGANASRVVRHARCSVLVVRE